MIDTTYVASLWAARPRVPLALALAAAAAAAVEVEAEAEAAWAGLGFCLLRMDSAQAFSPVEEGGSRPT